jgi:hypothetical protein
MAQLDENELRGEVEKWKEKVNDVIDAERKAWKKITQIIEL